MLPSVVFSIKSLVVSPLVTILPLVVEILVVSDVKLFIDTSELLDLIFKFFMFKLFKSMLPLEVLIFILFEYE